MFVCERGSIKHNTKRIQTISIVRIMGNEGNICAGEGTLRFIKRAQFTALFASFDALVFRQPRGNYSSLPALQFAHQLFCCGNSHKLQLTSNGTNCAKFIACFF